MSSPPIIFVDDRRAVSARHTGIGTYGRLLLDGLSRRTDIRLLRASTLRMSVGEGIGVQSQTAKLFADQALLPLGARPADVYHAIWHEGSPLLRTPLVLSVHDLDIVHNAPRYSRLQRWYYGGLLRPLVRRAKVVLVPSNFTARDVAHWRADTRIEVVPYAVDPRFFAPKPANTEAVLDRFGLKAGAYALYTGGVHARKGLATLFDGAARFQRRVPDVPALVLTGPAGADARAQSVLAGCACVFTGVLAVPELHALYSGAALVVSASVNEGFGYPAAEALATQRPFVCPDQGALPETGGATSMQFPAGDAQALATTMERALGSAAPTAERLAQAQLEAQRRFSVDSAAEAAVRCYKLAASCESQATKPK